MINNILRIFYLVILALVAIDVFNLLINDVYPGKWPVVAWGVLFIFIIIEEFAFTFMDKKK